MMVKAYVPIWLISWLILFPVNSVGLNNNDGLSRFTFGNIPPSRQSRLWAHLILDYVFVCKSELRLVRNEINHSLDPLPDLARDAALACCPTAVPSLEIPFEATPS